MNALFWFAAGVFCGAGGMVTLGFVRVCKAALRIHRDAADDIAGQFRKTEVAKREALARIEGSGGSTWQGNGGTRRIEAPPLGKRFGAGQPPLGKTEKVH